MGQNRGDSYGNDGPAFLALAAVLITLLLISLFVFGFACTIPPL